MVDELDPTPLYIQVADALRARILSGELEGRDRVPSESDLMREHGVARGTARRALKLLRDEGLVVTLASRGSFVADADSPSGDSDKN